MGVCAAWLVSADESFTCVLLLLTVSAVALATGVSVDSGEKSMGVSEDATEEDVAEVGESAGG